MIPTQVTSASVGGCGQKVDTGWVWSAGNGQRYIVQRTGRGGRAARRAGGAWPTDHGRLFVTRAFALRKYRHTK